MYVCMYVRIYASYMQSWRYLRWKGGSGAIASTLERVINRYGGQVQNSPCIGLKNDSYCIFSI